MGKDADALLAQNPDEASNLVADLIGLPGKAVKALECRLNISDEDAILALRLNPQWVSIHGQAAPDAVLDAIMTIQKQVPRRRDSDAGYRWMFQFCRSSDICDCREDVIQNSPVAFGLSPAAVGVAAIPMAFCAIVHKLAVAIDRRFYTMPT
jgi:hypothetical protein